MGSTNFNDKILIVPTKFINLVFPGVLSLYGTYTIHSFKVLYSHFLQVGDLKGLFGLFMVNMQILRAKLKVLDMTYGIGTGKNFARLSFVFVPKAERGKRYSALPYSILFFPRVPFSGKCISFLLGFWHLD